MRKEYDHNKRYVPEAVGFSKKEHEELTDQVQEILKALANSDGKKSKAVEGVEKVVKDNTSRENAYIITLAIEFFDHQLKEAVTKSIIGSSFLSEDEQQKTKKQDLPDDVKKGYI